MTQNGGIDVLIAWCIFGVLVVLLCWFVLRGHDDATMRADESDQQDGDDQPRDDDTDADRPGYSSAPR
ncbi:hypothetical protein [Flexivirga sp.]|uniref:hypothetical protein n=1 Tax=Flexivirga sp. TaxID=1962927 RepID=UPI003F816069